MSDKHQPDERRLPAELAAVERQLAGLAPAGPRIDRDRLMFEAGRAAAEAELHAVHLGEGASVASSRSADQGTLTPALSPPRRIFDQRERGKRWFWPAATATMTAATVLLSVMLVRQDQRLHAVQLVSAERESTPAEAPAATPSVDHDADDSLMLAESQDVWPLGGQPTRGYLGARYVALTRGVDALAGRQPRPAVVADGDLHRSEPPTARELLQQMLPSVAPDAS